MALTLYPTSGQSLDETRDAIRNNFSFINTGFLANHVELNTGANSGKHTAIKLVNQQNAPSAPATIAGESCIYSAPSLSAPNNPALFFKGQNLAASNNGYNFTSSIIDSTPTDNSSGWTRLPSGIILKWGFATVSPNSLSAVISFATGTGVPSFQFLPSATVSLTSPNTTNHGMDKALFVADLSTTTIKVYNANANGSTRTWYYFVIGV